MTAANQEAKKFLDVCYKLQEKYGMTSKEAEALTKIISYCKHFCREFNVAGFFNIDKTVILCILGYVTTYFIIVIQLNQSQYLQTEK